VESWVHYIPSLATHHTELNLKQVFTGLEVLLLPGHFFHSDLALPRNIHDLGDQFSGILSAFYESAVSVLKVRLIRNRKKRNTLGSFMKCDSKRIKSKLRKVDQSDEVI